MFPMSMIDICKHFVRLAALLLLAAVIVLPASGPAAASSDYAYYARSLLSRLPENAGARPDLEEYLDKLVSSYRQSKGRKRLIASELMREAARAQAADMMFAGKSNHRSRSGHGFEGRMPPASARRDRRMRARRGRCSPCGSTAAAIGAI
jgi:hypothetical protein